MVTSTRLLFFVQKEETIELRDTLVVLRSCEGSIGQIHHPIHNFVTFVTDLFCVLDRSGRTFGTGIYGNSFGCIFLTHKFFIKTNLRAILRALNVARREENPPLFEKKALKSRTRQPHNFHQTLLSLRVGVMINID